MGIIGQPLAVLFTPEDKARGESEQELRTATIQGRSEDTRIVPPIVPPMAEHPTQQPARAEKGVMAR